MDPKDNKENKEEKKIETKVEEPVEIVAEETEQKEDPHAAEITKLKETAEEMKNKYLRALADYQNFEKRVREEKFAVGEEVTFQLLLRLVPFLDNLVQAEIFIKDKGLEMIRKQYYQGLEEMGLKEIPVLGKEFDPHVAEAIEMVEGEKDDIMVEVLRKGYQYHDKVLRPAQVKVSKKKVN